MNSTYSSHSAICTKFYDLVIDPKAVASFVHSKISAHSPKRCLFVGGFFLVAKELQGLGLEIALSDYSEEMIEQSKERLPGIRAVVADLRDMPFDEEFDAVLVVGRVFTHMLTTEDSALALKSIRRALKPGGVCFIDNYEDSKIQLTEYFNGKVIAKDSSIEIIRESSTELISKEPMLVNWKANYRANMDGELVSFRDEMLHRAFSRNEMAKLLQKAAFKVCQQGDNFDETSFFSVAKLRS